MYFFFRRISRVGSPPRRVKRETGRCIFFDVAALSKSDAPDRKREDLIGYDKGSENRPKEK